MIQQSHSLLGIQPKKINLDLEEISALPSLALFTIAKTQKQSKCQQTNG